MAVTSKSLEEIHLIRDRWAAMPDKEVRAEQQKLFASAMRRMTKIRKRKAASAEFAPSFS